MSLEVGGQPRTRRFGHGYKVLYTHCLAHLSAYCLGYDSRRKSLAGQIHGRRRSGRSAAKDHGVVFAHDRRRVGIGGFDPAGGLKFGDKVA